MRKEKFFIACALGVEEELHRELQEVWPYLRQADGQLQIQNLPECEVFQGGLEFETPLDLGLQLNFFLKLANRILLRVDQFRVVDFPKLFHRSMQIEWQRYGLTQALDLHISAEKSKLGHEKRIAQTFQDVLTKRKLKIADKNSESADESATQKLFVRLSNDICTISLDTSGDLLYKRSGALKKGEAPMRETWAQFCLRRLIGDRPLTSLREIALLDPMVGSGTFLLEARGLLSAIQTRNYAFQKWSLCPSFLKTGSFLSSRVPPVFADYYGLDVNAKMTSVTEENWCEFYPKESVPQLKSLDSSKIFSLDFKLAKSCWIISNPPYGDRLAIQGGAHFRDLVQVWTEHLQPEKLALVIPEDEARTLKPVKNYRVSEIVPFKNGGIRVALWVLEKI